MSPGKAGLFIDGAWRNASNQEEYPVYSPASGDLVTLSASASADDCQEAIDAAARALPAWEATPPSARRKILLKATDLLDTESYRKRMVASACEETAATVTWASINASSAVNGLREASSLATRIRGETLQSEHPGVTFIVQRRAIGVILAISPWNAPAALSVRAVAIPLVCGNTVVLKSSEISPRSQSIVIEAFHEAGLPKGVLNYVSISKENVPKLTADMIAHPAVRKINFTGSDRVGKIIAAEAAKWLKPCVFELGGKAPAVVLDDANVHDASRAIVHGAMLHSGQICMSTERVIVQRGISEALISAITSIVKKLKASKSLNDATAQLSPVFSSTHAQGVLSLISDAKKDGAEVLVGDLTVNGALIQPHVLLGVKPGMRAWERESFGPVIGISVVDTVDEAVELANSSDYSLTASLWSSDVHGALQTASKIRAGTVQINAPTLSFEPSFGNFGLGGATGYGRFDIDHFTDLRAIAVNPPNGKYPLVDNIL
ncbi:aldehyde dehydrogenase [Sistotremastrum suecicum HHB10207 ss-3]|uniref:Aldehyde dehydrogenase n=1 Tax=Sistotremastrum suecicum HHB10207 ss-3 TaxID=1314776 RepID=A0A166GD88_9AGAM|nr:aldehyde dehydrogenase [Sistotremastrum suecicum HHB10207 ss-3]